MMLRINMENLSKKFRRNPAINMLFTAMLVQNPFLSISAYSFGKGLASTALAAFSIS